MEKIAEDVAIPLQVIKNGNKYKCIAMDYFPKQLDYEIQEKEAIIAARALVDQYVTRFGRLIRTRTSILQSSVSVISYWV